MFILSKISDLIPIPPASFTLPTSEAIAIEINTKYANKIIPSLGLCISLYDILSISHGTLKPGDASPYLTVSFRLVVWKPFVGEVITATIGECTRDGMRINLGFFSDIWVGKDGLFTGSVFRDGAWCWMTDEENGLWMDPGETVRIRCEEEIFSKIKPKSPQEIYVIEQRLTDLEQKKALMDEKTQQGLDTTELAKEIEQLESQKEVERPAYVVMGSCQSDGMGCVSWWD